MRRLISIAAMLAVLAAAVVQVASAQDTVLDGAWIVTSLTDTSGYETEAQPGLFIFTGTHYSIMYVPGPDEREQYTGEKATEADMIAAYKTFIANSGRYEVSGDQITYRAYVAKNPNYMGSFPEIVATATVHIDGDILHWTVSDGRVFTMQRVEGSPVPWADEE